MSLDTILPLTALGLSLLMFITTHLSVSRSASAREVDTMGKRLERLESELAACHRDRLDLMRRIMQIEIEKSTLRNGR